MFTTLLLLASIGQADKLGDPEPPAPPPAVDAPRQAPPAAACTCDQDATAKALKDLKADLDRLRFEISVRHQPIAPKVAASQAPATTATATPPPAQAPADPPKSWTLKDDSGQAWTSTDPDQLMAYVQRRNTALAAPPVQTIAAPTYYASPPVTYSATPPAQYRSFGLPTYSSGYSSPMSFGGFGGFMSGCASGDCR